MTSELFETPERARLKAFAESRQPRDIAVTNESPDDAPAILT